MFCNRVMRQGAGANGSEGPRSVGAGGAGLPEVGPEDMAEAGAGVSETARSPGRFHNHCWAFDPGDARTLPIGELGLRGRVDGAERGVARVGEDEVRRAALLSGLVNVAWGRGGLVWVVW